MENRHLIICVVVIFGTFIPYSLVQESIFLEDGFRFSGFLTLCQFISYSLFGMINLFLNLESIFDRKISSIIRSSNHYSNLTQTQTQTNTNKTMTTSEQNWLDNVKMSILMVGSLYLSNVSAVHLSYPLKVLLKSSKLIPTMLTGVLFFGQSYSSLDYIATTLLISGISLFSIANSRVSLQTSSFGIVCMLFSLLSESVGQNTQSKHLNDSQHRPAELLWRNSVVGTALVFFFELLRGELFLAIEFSIQRPWLLGKILLLCFLGYLGGLAVMSAIKNSGIFVAMTVTTCRKLSTIVLSFIVFPKPLSFLHLLALFLAFAGIGLNVYYRTSSRKRDKNLVVASSELEV